MPACRGNFFSVVPKAFFGERCACVPASTFLAMTFYIFVRVFLSVFVVPGFSFQDSVILTVRMKSFGFCART